MLDLVPAESEFFMKVKITDKTPESIKTLVAVLNRKVRALVAGAKKTGTQQTKLAHRCGVDQSDMSKFCKGADMSLNFLGKIIEVSGCVVSNISLIPIPAPKPKPKPEIKIVKAAPKPDATHNAFMVSLDELLALSANLIKKEGF